MIEPDIDVPRDRSHYSPTVHAASQRKYRGIEWEWVGETIENGGCKHTHKSGVFVFVYNIEEEGNVRVVADIEQGEILTIMWASETAERKHTILE